MRCNDVQEWLLNHSTKKDFSGIDSEIRTHLDQCGACQKEWRANQQWLEVLGSPARWEPDPEFIHNLVNNAVREKNRASLTDSVVHDLGLGNGHSSWLLNMFRSPRAIGAIASVVCILFFTWWVYIGPMNRLGNFDYIQGNVIVHSEEKGVVQRGFRINKGTIVQTTKDAEAIAALHTGSEIVVSSFSRLVFENDNLIRLEKGEAFFQVEKGYGKFRVQVPNGEVVVLGTEFFVTVDQGRTNVSVVEGLVQVNAMGKEVQIHPGFESTFSHEDGLITQQAKSLQQNIHWVKRIQHKRNREELQNYYPSLASPEKLNDHE